MPRPETEPRKEPRQERSRALVDALIDATEQLMAADGVAALTTARVAERAGASIGSLYQYFPGVEALIAAVIERRLEADVRELAPVLETLVVAPFEAAVAGLVEIVVRYYRDETPLYREMVAAMSTVDREDHVRRVLDGFERAILQVLDPHRERITNDLETAAFVLRTALIGCVREAATYRPELLADGRLDARLVALALGVLEGQGTGR